MTSVLQHTNNHNLIFYLCSIEYFVSISRTQIKRHNKMIKNKTCNKTTTQNLTINIKNKEDCDTPNSGCPLTTRQLAEKSICLVSRDSYLSKNASWAHKPILIKTNIITILQLSPNNSIVDYTFIQTYIKIYNSNTCYVQKPSKPQTGFFKISL